MQNKILSIDPLDAHDRLESLVSDNKQTQDISECCQDLINKRPFGDHAFYIFVHFRTEDDGINKRAVWQPRLTKPVAQPNTMLFKAYPNTDEVRVIWMLPAVELWGQYRKGVLTENQLIAESIHDFQTDRAKLERPEPDDLCDATIKKIYTEILKPKKVPHLWLPS